MQPNRHGLPAAGTFVPCEGFPLPAPPFASVTRSGWQATSKTNKYLTFGKIRLIISLQIPKIAIIGTPVCGMHKEHQPASFRS